MKVIICDDQALVREGLEMLLNLDQDIEVVATAENGFDALKLVEQHTPHLVLMDLKMPVMNGIEATREIRRKHPQVKVLVLTTYDHDDWLFDAIRAGASGYLLKDAKREEIIRAIKGTLDGKTYLDPKIAGKVMDNVNSDRKIVSSRLREALTDREWDVLSELAKGFANSEIAERLHLSEGTVRNHVSAILTKLNLTDRTQAAILAVKHGLDAKQEE